MIHVLDYDGNIIDFVSKRDDVVISAVHHRNINDRTETFDFTILSSRAENLQERNRIIMQDSNGEYREFIVEHIVQDIDGYTDVETSASYLEDITTGVPYPPKTFEKMTVQEALRDVLNDTGWEVSEQTEFAGIKTTSWTSYQTRYEVLLQLCTTYELVPDFYIELGSNKVNGRYVVLKHRNPLFNGKEIVYGKDLLNMKRTVDLNDVKTALLCIGPQKEDGSRIELQVKDDDAQKQFGLQGRYLWGIYEPESSDEDMSEGRLRTLGTTELNKRKVAGITYEVKSVDIKQFAPHEVVQLRDLVRIKNRNFTPPLYVEAEVVGEDYDLISESSDYTFGQYKEYVESDLRKALEKRMNDIQQKLNDNISNINTIIADTNSELQYFEKKIIKSSTPPTNPVNDMLWYDTSNPNVAVIRRYWNGEWIESTVENVEQIGGITREKALFSELSNTFINLSIQHSRVLNDVYEVINSEYFVDMDLKNEVQTKLNNTIDVFNAIKVNLESMKPETATIGKLIDTQALFLNYREKMQSLYTSVENAKIAIDKHFKLLQSQYTDEKYNEAMKKVAESIGGTWDSESNQLIANISTDTEIQQAIKKYADAQDNLKLVEAQAYADNIVSEEEQRAIDDANKKLQEAKTYSDQKSHEVLQLADQHTDGKLTTITATQTKQSTDIKKLQDSITLKADKSEITTMYDNNIKPLETKVNENKSQLQIQSDKIDSKVSNAQYTADYKNVVTRLNSADTQRQQLSNAINDRVTLTQFNDNKTATTNQINSAVDSIEVGGRNLLRSYYGTGDISVLVKDTKQFTFTGWGVSLYTAAIFNPLLTVGKTYTLTFDIEVTKASTLKPYALDYSLRIYDRTAAKTLINASAAKVEGKVGDKYHVSQTFVVTQGKWELIGYSNLKTPDGTLGTTRESDELLITNLKLEEGNKPAPWTPALEDTKQDIEKAQLDATSAANKYTDDKQKQTDQTLSTLQTQINQNGKDINLRATKDEFNQTRKTLSKAIADFTVNTTTGLTLSYDSNGVIQSSTIGPNGIKLDATKIDINNGDVTIQNGVTTIKDAYINKLTSNNAFIQNLKSIDIETNKLVGKGENITSTLANGKFEIVRSDNSRLQLGIDGITTFDSSGRKQYSLNSTYVSSSALGTSTSNVYLATSQGYEVRAVDVTQIPGDGAVDSYRYVPIRADKIYAEGIITNQGKDLYLGSNNEVRATSRAIYDNNGTGSRMIFSNIRAKGFIGNSLEVNNENETSHLYLKPSNGFEVRCVKLGSTESFVDMKAEYARVTAVVSRLSNSSMYIGSDNEIRFTKSGLANNGNPVYNDIRFRNWNAMSSEKYKYDIQKWDYSVLDTYRNDLQLYTYKNLSEMEDEFIRNHHGIIIEREIPIEWRHGDGFDGNEVLFWNTKAIQELIRKIDVLEEQLNDKQS